MRTMAIDYGDQRIGLAVSDLLGMLAGEAWTMQEWDMERAAKEVHLWDERRTTVEAHNILSAHNYHGQKRKNTVDAVAASLILEGWLGSGR